MRFHVATVLLILSFQTFSQTGSFTDPRDGQVYRTIVIGNKKWMREHLRFQTSTSWCPPATDISNCAQGNYYFNSDLPSVCPVGWRVVTTTDWKEYIDVLAEKLKVTRDSLQLNEYFNDPPKVFIHTIKTDLLKDTMLNLVPLGWIEGSKKKNLLTLSMWIANSEISDPKYHLHLGAKNYHIHSHDHNIIDKPKKIRRFPVRCVCEQSF